PPARPARPAPQNPRHIQAETPAQSPSEWSARLQHSALCPPPNRDPPPDPHILPSAHTSAPSPSHASSSLAHESSSPFRRKSCDPKCTGTAGKGERHSGDKETTDHAPHCVHLAPIDKRRRRSLKAIWVAITCAQQSEAKAKPRPPHRIREGRGLSNEIAKQRCDDAAVASGSLARGSVGNPW